MAPFEVPELTVHTHTPFLCSLGQLLTHTAGRGKREHSHLLSGPSNSSPSSLCRGRPWGSQSISLQLCWVTGMEFVLAAPSRLAKTANSRCVCIKTPKNQKWQSKQPQGALPLYRVAEKITSHVLDLMQQLTPAQGALRCLQELYST